MLKVIPQRKIKKDWEFYKEYITKALGNTYGDKLEEGLKVIFGKLMSPFSPEMHLWKNNNYIILTYIIQCEFTQRKSLMLYAFTKTDWSLPASREELNRYKAEVFIFYKEFYDVTSSFALNNNCYELLAFTPLDHIAKMANVIEPQASINYTINFPLNIL